GVIFSSSCNGEICAWNLATKICTAKIKAHDGFVRVSGGETVQLWEPHRSSPLQTFSWGSDSVYCVRFNPAETSIFGAGLSGNSVALYDIRGNTPIRRVLMKMRTNAISWNPMQPINFTVASEDQNLYTYDMRKLSEALRVHKDFVNAVLDVDYSPTGKEFVAASFDGTLRFVLSCRFSADGRFVFSGSADMCLRVWKSEAAAALGPQSYRARLSLNYRKKLQEKYAHLPEIKRIERHHHVPKLIKKTQEKKRIMKEAAKRREDNRIAHSKPGKHPRVAERKKAIYREIQ
ncbi:WD domain, G-beta repeat-containing protein, putative, partial [Eimeria acervulina]